MPAFQLHYTSSRMGQSGTAGFQSRTWTSGLSLEDRRETESRGDYTRPRDLSDDQPTAERILEVYPRAFRYYMLTSGRWAMTYSCYTGRDYSGRWGNFFAHSLIAEASALPTWPIDYYEWAGWKTALSPDEDGDAVPPLLPAIELETIPAAASFTREELQAFLQEDGQRSVQLAAMIRAVRFYKESSRAIVIKDTFLNGLFWIACIQKAFPAAHARHLGFSTYQFDPRGAAVINATTGRTDFAFNDTERKYQFFMFDFVEARHSDVSGCPGDYAETLAGWMATQPNLLGQFHQFATLFTSHELDGELDSLLRLFQLRSGDVEVAQLAKVVSFADRFIGSDNKGVVLEMVARVAADVLDKLSIEDGRLVTRFLAQAAASTRRPEHRDQAFSVWLRLLTRILWSSSTADVVQASREEVLQALGSDETRLAEMMVDEAYLGPLAGRAHSLSPVMAEELLSTLVVSLHLLGKRPAWQQPESIPFLKVLLSSGESDEAQCARILGCGVQDTETLVGLCQHVAALCKGMFDTTLASRKILALGRSLHARLALMPATDANAIRFGLLGEPTWEVLHGECLARLEGPSGSLTEYLQCKIWFKTAQPEYWQRFRADAALGLLNWLEPAERGRVALDLIVGGECHGWDAVPIARVVTWANEEMALDTQREVSVALCQQFIDAAIELGAALQPNRPLLRLLLATGVEDLNRTFMAAISAAIKGLPSSEYLLFVSALFGDAIPRVTTVEQHGAVLSVIGAHPVMPQAVAIYLGVLDALRRGPAQSVEVALLYWLGSSADVHTPQFRGDSLERLTVAMAAMDEEALTELQARVRVATAGSRTGSREWLALCTEVSRRRQSLWEKALKFFKRGPSKKQRK